MVVEALVVSRLVPAVITTDIQDILGSCPSCGNMIEVNQAVVLDWQAEVLIHKYDKLNCLSRYIENYLRVNKIKDVEEVRALFGLSVRTAWRRLQGVRRYGT